MSPGGKSPPEFEQLLFRLTHQGDEDLALAPTLAAKAPHDLLQRLVEGVRRELQTRARERALRADAFQEVQEFF